MTKLYRNISVIEHHAEDLDVRMNRIFDVIAEHDVDIDIKVNQTYRTYESLIIGGKKNTMRNVSFYTNSLSLSGEKKDVENVFTALTEAGLVNYDNANLN